MVSDLLKDAGKSFFTKKEHHYLPSAYKKIKMPQKFFLELFILLYKKEKKKT